MQSGSPSAATQTAGKAAGKMSALPGKEPDLIAVLVELHPPAVELHLVKPFRPAGGDVAQDGGAGWNETRHDVHVVVTRSNRKAAIGTPSLTQGHLEEWVRRT